MLKQQKLYLLFNRKLARFFTFLCLFYLSLIDVFADEKHVYAAIVIDDIGDNLYRGERALQLQGAVTFSILPHTPYAKKLALAAHQSGKEVMLHMPMQPEGNKNMGPGGLTHFMNKSRFLNAVKSNLQAIPHVAGINNHMGSLLTQKTQQMHWVMQSLRAMGDYYFVDSMTHQKSIAHKVAADSLIPNTSRDVFLDHEISLFAIDEQFSLFITKVKQNGFALAIGHPHNETLMALEYWIPEMVKQGIELVPVSQYIQLKDQRNFQWQASLSHSRKAAKN